MPRHHRRRHPRSRSRLFSPRAGRAPRIAHSGARGISPSPRNRTRRLILALLGAGMVRMRPTRTSAGIQAAPTNPRPGNRRFGGAPDLAADSSTSDARSASLRLPGNRFAAGAMLAPSPIPRGAAHEAGAGAPAHEAGLLRAFPQTLAAVPGAGGARGARLQAAHQPPRERKPPGEVQRLVEGFGRLFRIRCACGRPGEIGVRDAPRLPPAGPVLLGRLVLFAVDLMDGLSGHALTDTRT